MEHPDWRSQILNKDLRKVIEYFMALKARNGWR
jgi:hypothetical protein